ncbi:MAG: tetratricopeptide repeat protein [Cyanobacteria bacterium J06634_6]
MRLLINHKTINRYTVWAIAPILLLSVSPAIAQNSPAAEGPSLKVSSYQEAVRLHPDNADAHYNLGYWLAQQGQTEQAIAAYRRAIQLSPFDTDAYYNLGILLHTQRQFSEAEVVFRRVVLIDPEYENAYQYLSIVLADQDRQTETSAAQQAIRQLSL